MKRQLACLLAAFAWSGLAAAADVEQSTRGWCSPAINGSQNTFTCAGVDPRAVARLNELLDLKDLSLQQKTAEANEWVRKYNELNAQLTDARRQLEANGEDATLVQTAQDLLHEGKLDEARKIYDRLIASDDANVDRAAEHHFTRAIIFALQFRMVDALPDYAEAYQLRPHELLYASEYGRAAFNERQYAEAERVWTGELPLSRNLAARDPAYKPVVATTLNDLGTLYEATHRLTESKKALSEALTVRRDLAARDPAYRADVAMTLLNLGNLYGDTDRSAKAKKTYGEALTILRDIAARDPAYHPFLAITLNNLGLFYADAGDLPSAEKAYDEALSICRDLAARYDGYRPDLGATLNNLGLLYVRTSRPAKAEKTYNEALSIRRDLAARDPGAYRPALASTLNNLANLYHDTDRAADAEKVLSEAVSIFRDLAADDPAYRPVLAADLTNIGSLYGQSGRIVEAEQAFTENLAVYRELAANNPAQYAGEVEKLTKLLAEIHTSISAKR
jgi:Tfp pilus assembly protein PilF